MASSPAPWRWRPVSLASMAGWDKAVLEDATGKRIMEARPGSFSNADDPAIIAAAADLLKALRELVASNTSDCICECPASRARVLLVRLGARR